MRILFVASECYPFVKTGGLADVTGALAPALAEMGHEVTFMMPLYKEIAQNYRSQIKHELYFYINLGWRRQYCGIETLKLNGVKYIFLDNEYYYDRDSVYGYGPDECERFAFLCRAALEAIPHAGIAPDVIHCHDWQTGLIPVLLKTQYQSLDLYKDIKTMFTIHNLMYQGIFDIGLVEDLLGLGTNAYTSDKLEFYGSCSFMKGALVYSDIITTVSPNYAQEIRTPFYGERLDGVINSRGIAVTGILNGIDTDIYDPETDPHIASNYTAETYDKKAVNKRALKAELGLEADPDAPLIGMVTRLSGQKGLDLVEFVLSDIMNLGVQIAVLGKGEERFSNLLRWAQWRYEGRMAARIEMNSPLASRIYAGSDFFLMPSLFEPCGLSQMISLRYGTLPIVRETGGLKDTVTSLSVESGEGNGFSFYTYNAHDMLQVIHFAVDMYKNDYATYKKIAIKAMRGEYGWARSAEQYSMLYEKLSKD